MIYYLVFMQNRFKTALLATVFLSLFMSCGNESTADRDHQNTMDKPGIHKKTGYEIVTPAPESPVKPTIGRNDLMDFADMLAKVQGKWIPEIKMLRSTFATVQQTTWTEDSTFRWQHISGTRYTDPSGFMRQMQVTAGEQGFQSSKQYYFDQDSLFLTIEIEGFCEDYADGKPMENDYIHYTFELFDEGASSVCISLQKSGSCIEEDTTGSWNYELVDGAKYEYTRQYGTNLFDSLFFANPLYLGSQFANSIAEGDTICYQLVDDKTLDEEIVVHFLSNNTISGFSSAEIHDHEMDYFTYYGSDFSGTLEENRAVIDIEFEIEGYTETKTEYWTFYIDSLVKEGRTYIRGKCKGNY